MEAQGLIRSPSSSSSSSFDSCSDLLTSSEFPVTDTWQHAIPEQQSCSEEIRGANKGASTSDRLEQLRTPLTYFESARLLAGLAVNQVAQMIDKSDMKLISFGDGKSLLSTDIQSVENAEIMVSNEPKHENRADFLQHQLCSELGNTEPILDDTNSLLSECSTLQPCISSRDFKETLAMDGNLNHGQHWENSQRDEVPGEPKKLLVGSNVSLGDISVQQTQGANMEKLVRMALVAEMPEAVVHAEVSPLNCKQVEVPCGHTEAQAALSESEAVVHAEMSPQNCKQVEVPCGHMEAQAALSESHTLEGVLLCSNKIYAQGDDNEHMRYAFGEESHFDDLYSQRSLGSFSGERITGGLEVDCDIQSLENSLKIFELHKSSSALSHHLPSLSSGCGRPDLEEVDEQIDSSESVDKNKPRSCSSVMSDSVVRPNMAVARGQVNATGSNFNCVDDGSLDGLGFPLITSEVLQLIDPHPKGESMWKEVVLASDYFNMHGIQPNSSFQDSTVQYPKVDSFHSKPVVVDMESSHPDELFRNVEALDVNEAYLDTVLDMEEVLLNSDEISSGRFLRQESSTTVGTPRPSRDGSMSSSTSGTQWAFQGEVTPFTVDWVEVVGARQKKGGSSLGERMVGVKDHTVYCIKVVSGKQEWEVFRRYRDFVDLYHQLRKIFNTRAEKPLPSPWDEVESESRKVFGNTSSNVIEVRSFRIERCLQSLIQAGPPFSSTSPLFWFLRPQRSSSGLNFENHLQTRGSFSQKGSDVQLNTLDSPLVQSPRSDSESIGMDLDLDKKPFALGKTIKLVVNTHPPKTLKQLLYAQHHSCAGCYKHLDVEKGLMQGFVQTLGWGKPRLCEYSGQLFCSSCHINETAVLPAQVLQHWDFTPRRVSQLAKAYLDSIYDQPMLCVSAVNPHLYSRVPILSHVKETRRKLSKMLSCVRCPSRARIQQTMGSRRYLLENDDFFALRDLEDLSKGAFAVLPGVLTAVLENLRLHITKQCSLCQETGEWCGAGIICDEPFNPIFPFQEENVKRCKLCNTPYHKSCYLKCNSCLLCSKDRRNDPVHDAESSKEDGANLEVTTSLLDGLETTQTASSSISASPTSQLSSLKIVKDSRGQKIWNLYNLLPKPQLW